MTKGSLDDQKRLVSIKGARVAPSSTKVDLITLGGKARNADLEKIRQVLEMKMVGERLKQLGFTQAEIQTRLNSISDQQLHKFALQLDDLRVGGDGGAGLAIVVLLILVLFLMIMMLTSYRGGRSHYRR